MAAIAMEPDGVIDRPEKDDTDTGKDKAVQ